MWILYEQKTETSEHSTGDNGEMRFCLESGMYVYVFGINGNSSLIDDASISHKVMIGIASLMSVFFSVI